ncbi:MAG: efflux RND transporter periplasmic adaptor subunit, partial [Gemmataceae bacterium]
AAMANTEAARPALSDRVRSLRLAGRGATPAPRSQALPWAFSFVLLLTTAAFGYRAYRVGPAPAEPAPVETVKPTANAPVPTSSAATAGEVVLQSKGYVIPISLVQVSPKVGGQIEWLAERFKEGEKFKKGDLLARLERVDYESDYNQALFALAAVTERLEDLKKTMPEEIKQAEAELEEARASGTQQKLELDRNRRLATTSAIAQRELEQARFTYDATVARVKKLEASVRILKDSRFERRVKTAEAEAKQARAYLDKAKWRLDNTEIKAPVSGSILSKKAELGNIVNPSAFSSGISASLCEMADLTRLEIDLSVQERDIANVRDGQRCTVMPEAYKDDKEFLSRHQGYKGEVADADGRPRQGCGPGASTSSRARSASRRARTCAPTSARRCRSCARLLPPPPPLRGREAPSRRVHPAGPDSGNKPRRSKRPPRARRKSHDPQADCPDRGLAQVLPARQRADRRPQRPHPGGARGRVPRADGPVRIRQDDAAQPHRRA